MGVELVFVQMFLEQKIEFHDYNQLFSNQFELIFIDKQNNKEIYSSTNPYKIRFDNNEIHFSEEEQHPESINNFMKDIFDNPFEHKKYSFEYQHKQYIPKF